MLSRQHDNIITLTTEDIETYQRDGVVLIRNVLSGKQIDEARQAFELCVTPQYAGPQAEFIGNKTSNWNTLQSSFTVDDNNNNGKKSKSTTIVTNNDGGDDDSSSSTPPSTNTTATNNNNGWTMFQDQYSSKRCPIMMDFIRDSQAGYLAAKLMKSQTATFFYDHLISKRPIVINNSSTTSNIIPYHQDLPYWSVDGTFASVWFPLDDMSSKTAIEWIIGSHTWGLFQPRHFVDSSPYEGTDHMKPMPNISEMITKGKATIRKFSNINPGDALVFDSRIIHGSPANTDTVNGCKNESDDDGQQATTKTTTTSSSSSNSNSITGQRRIALRFGGDDAIYVDKNHETAIPTPDIIHNLKHGDKLSSSKEFLCLWPLPPPPQQQVNKATNVEDNNFGLT